MTATTLTRWDPFRDILTLQDRVNRLFGDSFTRLPAAEAAGAWFPPVDILEEGDQLVLRAELPGVNKDDIDIRVENGTVTLRGEKKLDRGRSSEGRGGAAAEGQGSGELSVLDQRAPVRGGPVPCLFSTRHRPLRSCGVP